MSTNSQGKGRPLSTAVANAVFKAALTLVEKSGLQQTTRLQIASKAKVSRQTLYNRWPSVGDIVLDALIARGESEIGAGIGDKACDDPQDELREYVTGLANAVNGWAAGGLKAVAALAQQDPEFERRFREDFLIRRHGRFLQVVTAACNKPTQNPTMIAELIASSMWYRLLISGQELDQRWVDSMLSLTD